MNEPPSLLRNDVTGTITGLRLSWSGRNPTAARSAARVLAKYGGKQQVQEVVGQSSYLSVSDRRLHFGLGAAETADLEIRWPSGAKESYAKVKADQLVIIKEGTGVVSSQKFPLTACGLPPKPILG